MSGHLRGCLAQDGGDAEEGAGGQPPATRRKTHEARWCLRTSGVVPALRGGACQAKSRGSCGLPPTVGLSPLAWSVSCGR